MPMTDQMKKEFRRDYMAGEPLRDLADKYGPSEIYLVTLARKLGCPRRNRYQTKWTEQGGYMRPWIFQREQLESLILGGLADEDIARALGRSADGVRSERRRLKYPTTNAVGTEAFLLTRGICGSHRAIEIVGPVFGARKILKSDEVLTARKFREIYRAARQENISWDREVRKKRWGQRLDLIKELDALGTSNRKIAEIVGISHGYLLILRKKFEIRQSKQRTFKRPRIRDGNSRILEGHYDNA